MLLFNDLFQKKKLLSLKICLNLINYSVKMKGEQFLFAPAEKKRELLLLLFSLILLIYFRKSKMNWKKIV